tara:strand:- start:3071 stop:3679 length:609 start_codon:yes stop_codon:yes gene_type:complete
MEILVSHITHIDNISSIISHSCLWSDARRLELNVTNRNIGYRHIKRRRLERPVQVAALGTIGHYVPFNFCPRSVMLYVIHTGHDDFNGGQEKIIHLVSSVNSIRKINSNCFFTDIHADLDYAEQIDDFSRIKELNLKRITTEQYWTYFKEEKQAEFLAYDSVKWSAIQSIGVKSDLIATEVHTLLQLSQHKPNVLVKPNWYY